MGNFFKKYIPLKLAFTLILSSFEVFANKEILAEKNYVAKYVIFLGKVFSKKPKYQRSYDLWFFII